MPEGGSILFQKIPRGMMLDRAALRRFHRQLQKEVTAGLAFDCLLTNDAALQQLNLTFLRKDYPTDVLSFPAEGTGGTIGDLAISVERAAEQATEFGHSLETEIQILMLHGALHLTGLDHEKDRPRKGKAGKMEQLETEWREYYGLPQGLIERAQNTTAPVARKR